VQVQVQGNSDYGYTGHAQQAGRLNYTEVTVHLRAERREYGADEASLQHVGAFGAVTATM
jgi:hypothetical protein